MRRRELLVGAVGAFVAACARAPSSNAPSAPSAAPSGELDALERRIGGRVGVFAFDGTGRTLAHRADERFAMCSTFKLALAAAILAKVDRGEIALDLAVAFGERDLQEYAPVTRARVAEGKLTIAELCSAAVLVSDNTAANLLLAKLGGPAGFTDFVRSAGDPTTRLDRIEEALNENAPGDPRDTTTPRAMATLARHLACDGVLSPESRERLVGWMRACETGKERLRASLPAAWNAGDKTGTGTRGAVNDVAVAWPPGQAPIAIASYLSDGSAPLVELVRTHAAIGAIVARTFAHT